MTDPATILAPVLLDVEPQPPAGGDWPTFLLPAVEHAHGTEDPVYAPSPPPGVLAHDAALQKHAGGFWLPEGYHYGLHVEHRPLESAGPMTGGGHKWLWHITVSAWGTVDLMWKVLRDKRAAPHLLIGGRVGLQHPVVIQMMPFNVAGRALAHSGGPETNRADCIQVEICANPADVPLFPHEHRYRMLANLVRMTNEEVSGASAVPRHLARSFQDTTRFGGQEFVDVSGHCGHMHAPENDHTDPTTAFKGDTLIQRLTGMPAGGWPL